jgi:hypothetical protein
MHFFAWLFGKQERSVAAPAPAPQKKQEPAAPGGESKPTAPVAEKPAPPRPPAQPPEVENLARWRASGQARAWVEARRGQWDHAAWLGLLGELQRSSFWPMRPEAIGAVLEEHKREWQQRK